MFLITFLLRLIMFIVCLPFALIALVCYPILWLILLPFRLLGWTAGCLFTAVTTVLTLPLRILSP